MMNKTHQEILDRTLCMLANSDTLDYAVEKSVPYQGGAIVITRSVSRMPLFRIAHSSTESISAWRITYTSPSGGRHLAHKAMVNVGNAEETENTLRDFSDIIEYCDNGRALSEWLSPSQPRNG